LKSLLDIGPSPLIQVIIRAINVWQLDHPGASKSDCEDWLLKTWRGSGRAEWESQAPSKGPVKDKGEKRKR
jgi:tRNA nucleotidyltransferase (CCA-adding enzyme)